jgi:hypothetical protein
MKDEFGTEPFRQARQRSDIAHIPLDVAAE